MLKDVRYSFHQFDCLKLELEMMEEGAKLNLEQLLRDAAKIQAFRSRFSTYRLLTYDSVTTYAERLRATDEFKDVESVQNLTFSNKWWEKLKERFFTRKSTEENEVEEAEKKCPVEIQPRLTTGMDICIRTYNYVLVEYGINSSENVRK